MTVKLRPPVDFVYGNLLVTPKGDGMLSRRRCWAGFEFMPIHYDFLPADRALAYHTALSRLFRELADLPEAVLQMVPEPVDGAEMQGRLLRRLTGDAADYCVQVMEALAQLQGEADETCRFRFFLWVELPGPSFKLGDIRRQGSTGFRQAVAAVHRGQGISDILLETWGRQEKAVRDRLATFGVSVGFGFRPLTRQDCLYLSRLPFWRGIGDPPLAPGWAPNATVSSEPGVRLKPDVAAMKRIYSGQVDHSETDHLAVSQIVDGEPRTAYQAFLTVEQFSPNPLPVLGGEWSYQLQEVGPVTLHIRWTARSYEATLEDIASQKRKQADTSEQEVSHAAGETADTARSRDETEEMELYVKDTRSPILLVSMVIGVTAPTPDVLRERIRQVVSVFDRLDIKLVQNGCDQVKHFYETLPGAGKVVEDYTHRLLPPALATAMFGATESFLDPSGTFIGTSVQGLPVWFEPQRALAKLDTSGSMAFVGPMGGGKSTAANFIAFLCALFGAKVLAIDSAKPERSEWPERLPYLGEQTRVVTLSAHERDRGKLDPYVIFTDRAEATNHAVSQAAFLTQTKLHEPGYDVLLRAFTEVRDNSPRPCMLEGIAALQRVGRDPGYKYRAEAERLAERLRNTATMAYANLLFGDGRSTGIDVSNRITVLQLDRIQRPPEGKEVKDYSMDEYIGHAILVAAVAFAGAFAAGNRKQQKVILADEIRWFVNNSYGRDLIEKQTLTGRAMGAQVLLIGQNVNHLPKDLHQHFTMRFAFGAQTVSEAVATLEFLGVEPTPEYVERLMSLNPPAPPVVDDGELARPVKGQCLVRDLTGRVGEAQICLLFDDLAEAFRTTSLEGVG